MPLDTNKSELSGTTSNVYTLTDAPIPFYVEGHYECRKGKALKWEQSDWGGYAATCVDEQKPEPKSSDE